MVREAVNLKGRLAALTSTALVLAGVAVVVNYRYAQFLAAENAREAAAPLTAPLPPVRAAARPDLAIQQAREHVQQHPRDRTARFRLAHLYFQAYEYAPALEQLEVLSKQDPRDAEVYLRKAVVLKYDARPDAAEREARRALAASPGYGLAEMLLGEIHLDQGRYRDALQVFERHLKRRPNSASALLGKGRALEQLYLAQNPIKVEQMLAPVEKAVRLAPRDARGPATLARMKFAYLNTQQSSAQAEDAALSAIQLDRTNPQPYVTLGQIYLARASTPENLEKAAEYAAQAGALDLHDPRPAYIIGRVSLQKNDLDRAIKALEHSVRLHPMAEAVTQLSVAYRRAGNAERANHYAQIYQRYMDLIARRDALMAAREREPKDVRHHYDLARLYLEAGQPDQAQRWLEHARALRPSDAAADELRVRLQELRKRRGDGPLLPIP